MQRFMSICYCLKTLLPNHRVKMITPLKHMKCDDTLKAYAVWSYTKDTVSDK